LEHIKVREEEIKFIIYGTTEKAGGKDWGV